MSQAVEQAESFTGIKQVVIHNALAHSFYTVAEQHRYPLLIDGDSDFNVLMICSLKAYKGIHEFIRIAALCSKETKIQFTLLLNANEQDIDAFFKDEKLTDNITLVPQQKNVLPFYAQASLLLNLSRPDEWVETFGLTIIEAMAFAIPVIVPPVGGPVEIVTDGQEGYLMSCYETDTIAEKIIELSQNIELCMQLSLAAKKRAGDFREEVFAGKVKEIV